MRKKLPYEILTCTLCSNHPKASGRYMKWFTFNLY